MNTTTKELVLQAFIAGLYVALTFAFQSVSFMAEQFRISEFLLILVLVHPKNALGILVGTALANTLSAAGPIDIVVGTFATYVAIQMMIRIKIKEVSYLSPAIANGVIIGIILTVLFELPILYTMGSVFVSEVIVTFVPWVLVGNLILKNETIREIFG